MSMNASRTPSLTRIWVRGAGRPSSIRISRSRVSRGDCAPPSISGKAIRMRGSPRALGYRSASNCTCGAVMPVARASASRWRSAMSRGKCRARSNAVRSGVVTGSPLIRTTSSASRRSVRTTIPSGGRPHRQIISMGVDASIQSAPCTAAAARPAMTPFRPTTTTRRRSCVRAKEGPTWTGKCRERLRGSSIASWLGSARHQLALRCL